VRHTAAVSIPEPRKPEKGLDHLEKARTRRHLHPHADVAVCRIPPIVLHIRFDGRGLSLTRNSRFSAPFDCQLSIKCGEALDYSGMAVFTGDPSSDTREELGDRAALGILVRKLDDCGALSSDRIFY
jgi:hypothetical protein